MGGSLEEKELQEECKERGYTHFVETGTYHGETSIIASKHFKDVDTIELCPSLYESAKKKLESFKNISVHKGDSMNVLNTLFPSNSVIENTFFFLDAHLSGQDTLCEELKIEVPLTQELKLLNNSTLKNCVICADDVRLWSEDKWSLSPEKVVSLFENHKITKTYIKNDRFYIFFHDEEQKNIGFYIDHFTFRGTNSAVFDYAVYNKKILGNISFLIYPVELENVKVLNEYKSNGVVVIPSRREDLQIIFQTLKLTALYTISRNSGIDSNGQQTLIEVRAAESLHLKCIVHCVLEMGNIPTSQGTTTYVGVSSSVSKEHKILPHIVTLPELKTDYRSFLNIPDSAIVYGRHGGSDTFDVPFVKKAIERIVQVRKDIYFLFAGEIPTIFREMKSHHQIIFINPFYDKYIKRKFINTCDYMIHGGKLGESFGLSCLEFDFCGKGVLTVSKEYIPDDFEKKITIYNTSHLEEVRNLMVYKDYVELVGFFINNQKEFRGTENKKFSPEYVMNQFSKYI